MLSHSKLDEVLAFQKNQDKTLHAHCKLGEMLVEADYAGSHHMVHTLLSAVFVATLLLSTVSDARAAGSSDSGSASAKILVTASVMPVTSLRIIRQPHELVVTNDDLSRGYVEVKASTYIEIRNNVTRGFLLSFEGLCGPFKEVYVQGLGNEVQITGGGGLVTQPYTKGTATRELSYRFVFSKDAKPGTYAWPLAISAQSL